jgi:iron complex transport system substrate-binding protein
MTTARHRPYRLLLLLALAGLWSALAAARADVVLPQPDGPPLTLAAPAQRVITLSPHLAELVYAAGAGERLVATVEYSDYPPPAARLPRIGDAFRLDLEAIVNRRPDLVIAWQSGNPPAALAQLRKLGIPVWSVEIREPAAIAAALRRIGTATGAAAGAEAAASAFEARLAALTQRFAGATPLAYFYQVDEHPLFTINGRHLISQGLALCGGRNIFDAEPGLAFQVAHEAVIAADPAALFAPRTEADAAPLAHWRQWPGLRAVRDDALFLLPADAVSRATPRWLDSLELACTLLHDLRERAQP